MKSEELYIILKEVQVAKQQAILNQELIDAIRALTKVVEVQEEKIKELEMKNIALSNHVYKHLQAIDKATDYSYLQNIGE